MTQERQQGSRDSALTPADDAGVSKPLSPPMESRLSDSQLRELADSLSHLVWTCLAEGPCDYLSGQWVAYTGIPEADQLGYGWLMQLHPDDRERVKAEWAATVVAGVAFDIEFRIRRNDGVHRWFRTRAIPLHDTSGKLDKWCGSNSDIDDYKRTEQVLRESEERKRLEDALRESEQRWRFAIEGAGDGLWDWDVPSRKAFFSTRYKSMLGYAEDEISDGEEEWTSRIHPEDLPRVMAELQPHLDGVSPSYAVEHRVRCKDDSYKWILARGLVMSRDAAGKPLRMVGTSKDITASKHGQEERLRNLSLLQMMSSASPIGYLVVDNRTDEIRFFNKRFCEIWGIEHLAERMERGELKHQDIISDCLPVLADVPAFAASCAPLQSEASRVVIDDEIPFTGGRTIRRYSTQLRGADDRFYGRFYLFEDVTRHKQAERREAAHIRTMAAMTSGVPLAEVLITVVRGVELEHPDTLGSVLLLDEAGTHLLTGAAPSLPPFYNDAIHGVAIGPTVGSCGTAAFRKERVVVPDIQTDPLWADYKNLAAEAGLAACWSEPILGDGGRLLGTFAFYFTEPRVPNEAELATIVAAAKLAAVAIERKQAEALLRISNLLLEASQSIAKVGGWELDLVTKKLFWTAETYRLHDTSPAEFHPTVDAAVGYFLPESRRIISAALETAMVRGESYDLVLETLTTKGRRIDVRTTCEVTMHDGRPTKLTGIFQDITERKQAEAEKEKLQAQLVQSQKMEAIGTLAGGVAHDFNNILAGLLGGLSLLEVELGEPTTREADLEDMKALVERGAQLTKQLLGFARRGKYNVKPLDLGHVVAKTSAMFGSTRRDITVHLEVAPGLSPALMDHTQLEQVLLNLFVNAGQAMAGGGQLLLRVEDVLLAPEDTGPHGVAPGQFVKLVITDTGTGMDAATQGRIFEPFFTTKEPGKGTGLGLASVYGIIKSYDGFIQVESELGKGTTFTIFLPASQEPVASAKTPAVRVQRGKGTILLVDDEAVILNVCARLLKTMGYEVLSAGGGKEAIELLRQHGANVSLVILDLTMPEMSGAATYRALREVVPGVKVLLSSGYSIEGQAQELLAQGCSGFIQKPFDASTLSAKLREFF